MEIKVSKLQEMMNELTAVVETMTSDEIKTNPRRIVELAKVIEKGEKRFTKEYERRLALIKETQAELLAIAEFADRMGYRLTDPETITEEAPEDEAQPEGEAE